MSDAAIVFDLDSTYRDRTQYPQPAYFNVLTNPIPKGSAIDATMGITLQAPEYPSITESPLIYYSEYNDGPPLPHKVTLNQPNLPFMYTADTTNLTTFYVDPLIKRSENPNNLASLDSNMTVSLPQADNVYIGHYLENLESGEFRQITDFTYGDNGPYVWQTITINYVYQNLSTTQLIGVSGVLNAVLASNIDKFYRGKNVVIVNNGASRVINNSYLDVNGNLVIETSLPFTTFPTIPFNVEIQSTQQWTVTIDTPFTYNPPTYPGYQSAPNHFHTIAFPGDLTANSGFQYHGVWGNNEFVILSQQLSIGFTSPEGLVYTEIPFGPNALLVEAIGYSPTLVQYVAVGQVTDIVTQWNIAYSPDGLNWTFLSVIGGIPLACIVWDPYYNQWVVGGTHILTSPDGKVWTSVLATAVTSIAVGIAFTGHGTGPTILACPDGELAVGPPVYSWNGGISWATSPNPGGNYVPENIFSVCYNPNTQVFMLAGYCSSGATVAILITNDVTNLGQYVGTIPNIFSYNGSFYIFYIRSLVFCGDSVFVTMYGQSTGDTSALVLKTYDGITYVVVLQSNNNNFEIAYSDTLNRILLLGDQGVVNVSNVTPLQTSQYINTNLWSSAIPFNNILRPLHIYPANDPNVLDWGLIYSSLTLNQNDPTYNQLTTPSTYISLNMMTWGGLNTVDPSVQYIVDQVTQLTFATYPQFATFNFLWDCQIVDHNIATIFFNNANDLLYHRETAPATFNNNVVALGHAVGFTANLRLPVFLREAFQGNGYPLGFAVFGTNTGTLSNPGNLLCRFTLDATGAGGFTSPPINDQVQRTGVIGDVCYASFPETPFNELQATFALVVIHGENTAMSTKTNQCYINLCNYDTLAETYLANFPGIQCEYSLLLPFMVDFTINSASIVCPLCFVTDFSNGLVALQQVATGNIFVLEFNMVIPTQTGGVNDDPYVVGWKSSDIAQVCSDANLTGSPTMCYHHVFQSFMLAYFSNTSINISFSSSGFSGFSPFQQVFFIGGIRNITFASKWILPNFARDTNIYPQSAMFCGRQLPQLYYQTNNQIGVFQPNLSIFTNQILAPASLIDAVPAANFVQYRIRKQLPLYNQSTGALVFLNFPNTTEIQLPFIPPTTNTTLIGSFLWIYSQATTTPYTDAVVINEVRTIVDMLGDVITIQPPLPNTALSNGPYNWEIWEYSSDQNSGLVMPLSRTAWSTSRCVSMEIMSITLPNLELQTGVGNRIAFYPYVYVAFFETNEAPRNLLYSNNPSASIVQFKIPITNVNSPTVAAYVVMGGGGIVQNCKFLIGGSVHFAVYLPNGDLFELLEQDNPPPLPANPDVQISLLVRIRPVK